MISLWNSVTSLAQRFAGWLSTRRARANLDALPLPPISAPEPILLPAIASESPAPVVARAPRKAASKTKDGSSNFYHLEDLLEQLPTCRQLLRKLRQLDEDAYDYHARVGARVLPKQAMIARKVNVDFIRRLPSAGMIFIPGDRDPEVYCSTFVHFQKLAKPSHDMAQIPGVTALYRVTVAWIRKGKRALGYQYALAVVGNDVRIVAERFEDRQHLPRGGYVVHSRWGVPPMLEVHFKDRKEAKGHDFDHIDLASFALSHLSCAGQYYTATLDEFLVRAERNNVSVSFGVALGRTPYFFKDRNTEAASDGKRKRIFHAVAAHDRTLRNGKVVAVPAHYRGERRFQWKGETVTITPPERAAHLLNVPAAIEVCEADMPASDYMGAAETGRLVQELLDRDMGKAA